MSVRHIAQDSPGWAHAAAAVVPYLHVGAGTVGRGWQAQPPC